MTDEFDAGSYSEEIYDLWNDITDKSSKDTKKLVDMVSQFLESNEDNDWMVYSVINEYIETYGREPKWEAILIKQKDLSNAISYCQSAKFRWKELEDKIENSKNIDLAIEYSQVIESRWEVCEKMILEKKDIHHVMDYINFFGFRWEEAEHILIKDPSRSVTYSIIYIKERWKEAEKSILKDVQQAQRYAEHFQFRWKGYENKIKNRPNRINYYAQKIIKGKLPDELHNRMLMLMLNPKKKHHAEDYFDFLKQQQDNTVKYLKSLSQDEQNDLLRLVK